MALALHGTWGAFWTAYGILELLYGAGRVTRPQGAFPELGFWFIVIAAITWAITAAWEKIMRTFLWLLAIASSLEAIAESAGAGWLRIVAAYFLIASALVAWYAASALMMRFVNAGKTNAGLAKTESKSARAA